MTHWLTGLTGASFKVIKMEIKEAIAEIEKIDKEYHYFNHIIKKPEEKNGKIDYFISVKDSICVKNVLSTAGSKILDGYLPRFDATAVKKVREAGGIIIGKTAQDAFGFGSFSTNVGLGKKVPLNPFDKTRCCGGSSGGAAGFTQKFSMPHIALGQSTGGSIVCPASFCGVVGLCPTYGRVSRYGLIDYTNSMDKIGPMAKTVRECALLLDVIAGKDDKDSTCIDKDKGFEGFVGKGIGGLKIGIIKEAFGKGVDPDVKKLVMKAVDKLGLKCDEVSLPLTAEYGIATYYLIAMTEASTNLAKYCGLRYGVEGSVEGKSFNNYFTEIRSANFNEESKRRIIIGTFARMAGFRDAYYLKAMKVRTLIIEEYKKLFKKYDVLISPTMPVIAPKFSEIEKMTPLQNYMMDFLTVGPNLTGLPHLTVPCGLSNDMPVGIMFIADHFNEGKIIQIGDYYEQIR